MVDPAAAVDQDIFVDEPISQSTSNPLAERDDECPTAASALMERQSSLNSLGIDAYRVDDGLSTTASSESDQLSSQQQASQPMITKRVSEEWVNRTMSSQHLLLSAGGSTLLQPGLNKITVSGVSERWFVV